MDGLTKANVLTFPANGFTSMAERLKKLNPNKNSLALLTATRSTIAVLAIASIWMEPSAASHLLSSLATVLWVFIAKAVSMEKKLIRLIGLFWKN